MGKKDQEKQARKAAKLAERAERKDRSAAFHEQRERPRRLFEQAREQGRRPGCPDSFNYPQGDILITGWIQELCDIVHQAIVAYRVRMRACDVSELMDSAIELETFETGEEVQQLLYAGRGEEVCQRVGIAYDSIEVDQLENEFPEIAPLAEELGLTWEGFLAFLDAAERQADEHGSDDDAGCFVNWIYLCQYDDREQLFARAGFTPSATQLRMMTGRATRQAVTAGSN